ncbi:protein DGCR14, partial [Tremellales sp. Uapishka_1]
MADDANALVPRTGPQTLIAGPKIGQRSLYQQQVLDEDTYTASLSHIITRDFFPHLPQLHATNEYLTALSTNDPELLSSSIRKLATLAQEKEDGNRGSKQHDNDGERARKRELEMMGTPYISLPGGPRKTPIGARGWDTPMMNNGEGSTRRRPTSRDYDELDDGPLPPSKKKKGKGPMRPPPVRDDLPLDAFQRNYTSEDNASFVQIVDEENRRRKEERWGWAWEAEKKAEMRRLEGEDKRRLILDRATSGQWMVNGEGRRLIGGLAEGGKEKDVGEAWKDIKMIEAKKTDAVVSSTVSSASDTILVETAEDATSGDSTALVPTSESSSKALVKSSESLLPLPPPPALSEEPLPPSHPLHHALTTAGLPTTALISSADGAVVPHRDVADGGGEGRGRGEEERSRRSELEKRVMGDEERETVSLGGSGADLWGYKARNNFFYPADAHVLPYAAVVAKSTDSKLSMDKARQAPPAISHSNTRLPDDEDVPSASKAGSSRRGSSPARSWVDAAVKGTPYRPNANPSMPTINSYPLLPINPSPEPSSLPSLLTWGTLLSTPRALDGSDDPLDLSTPSFRLPETKRRDELGRMLGNKASKSISARNSQFQPKTPNLTDKLRSMAERGNKSVRGNMGPPTATPKRNALTPAAKRLLDRSTTPSTGLGISSRSKVMELEAGWGGGTSSDGRKKKPVGWTPTPK